jgi:hypothetical protein
MTQRQRPKPLPLSVLRIASGGEVSIACLI